MRSSLICLLWIACSIHVSAAPPRALPGATRPADRRLAELRNLNSYFPFKPVEAPQAWPQRREEIRQRILLSQGLWPMPSKPDLNAVIHGRVERDDYVVDRVYFESIPGHFVTGSLYRPKGRSGPFPAILSPHGHWKDGRFYDAGEAPIRADLASGAERFEVGGRFPIQARAVQLARMGCLVFVYDMTGNADSIQIGHRPDKAAHLDRATDRGFFSAQAELRLQNMMGLQTWNSIRAVDFLLELDETDASRIGVTGASGGGTQSMILGAIDDRIAAAMPCVMVSTSMQGGCTCENAPYMRIDQGNVDIAAAIAPRPLGLTAADDWTVELETKGYPDLRQLYADLGHKDRLTAAFNLHFKHNYNHVNRAVMYAFFNRHLKLGFKEPILEQDYVPLSRSEATVWTDEHPAPRGDAIGDPHEVRILQLAAEESRRQMDALIPETKDQLAEFRRVVGGAWETILGRRLNQVQSTSFDQAKVIEQEGLSITVGLIDHAGEQLPFVEVRDSGAKGTVVWITDEGKQGLFDGDHVHPMVAKIARAGYRVVSADLIGQGEFVSGGDSLDAQRMWYQRGGESAWHRFAGYTYGYNHPLFVQRVHDVLSVIQHASSMGDQDIHLVGIGGQAGAIVAAARSQAGDAVGRTFIDLNGFRFASLQRQDDPMFVPGAVKYLDVGGLLSLCVPGRLDVVSPELPIVGHVERASGTPTSVRWHQTGEALLSAIGEWAVR
ncbi:Acetyl xylan esterase (AXE1) [Stieleria neptunia]|uniref:Acetyl xylan esterase (AXE1) n=1 Tax=Stieleria neptunia TaxID=2527979 RepID=A0A518HKD1_9BACT|nr:acetylxylan esterase [Stieleria neptunia]QDV41229.1 Acetyl xylan esterase (AXE1) [Stieleria neptunia]